jgi:ribokinase
LACICVVADLPASLYALVDVLTPNETEAEILTGVAVNDAASAEKAARVLQQRGAKAVIVTLGARGCVLVEREQSALTIAAPVVAAVDSTGAGDSFVGTLAYGLARGHSLADAARRAVLVASRSVLRPGTQLSYPSLVELRALPDFTE